MVSSAGIGCSLWGGAASPSRENSQFPPKTPPAHENRGYASQSQNACLVVWFATRSPGRRVAKSKIFFAYFCTQPCVRKFSTQFTLHSSQICVTETRGNNKRQLQRPYSILQTSSPSQAERYPIEASFGRDVQVASAEALCFAPVSALATCTSGQYSLKIPEQRRGEVITSAQGEKRRCCSSLPFIASLRQLIIIFFFNFFEPFRDW